MSVLGFLALAAVLLSATGGERVSVAIVAVLLSAVTIFVGSRFAVYRRRTQRCVALAIEASVISLALTLSVAVAHWPLHAAYVLSRASFETIAQRTRAGERVATPVRAGLFTIQRAELSENGIVCLWTFTNPSGNTGFVQCRHDYVPFNLWSIIRLDDRWQYISED